MSNNYWDEEDDDLDTQEYAGDGSDLLKKLRKAKRADEKRIKELTEQLEGLAARLVLKDLDDVNEESVSNWLDDNADLFGIKVAEQEAPVNQQEIARLRQQDILTQGALTPDRGLDVEQRMNQAGSAEELLSILQSQQ